MVANPATATARDEPANVSFLHVGSDFVLTGERDDLSVEHVRLHALLNVDRGGAM